MLDVAELRYMREQACEDFGVALDLIVELTDELITTAACERAIKYGLADDFDVGDYLVELKLVPSVKDFDNIVECYGSALELHNRYSSGNLGRAIFSNLPSLSCELADNILSCFESTDMLSCKSTAEYILTCLPIFYDSIDTVSLDSCMVDAIIKVCMEMVALLNRLGVSTDKESYALTETLTRYLTLPDNRTSVVLESIRSMIGYLLSEYENFQQGKGWG